MRENWSKTIELDAGGVKIRKKNFNPNQEERKERKRPTPGAFGTDMP